MTPISLPIDVTLWRSKFYGNQGWLVHPDYLHLASTPSAEMCRKAPVLPRVKVIDGGNGRQRASSTSTESSIAIKLGRRISEIVSGVGNLAMYGRSSMPSPETADRAARQRASTASETVAPPHLDEPHASDSLAVTRLDRAGTMPEESVELRSRSLGRSASADLLRVAEVVHDGRASRTSKDRVQRRLSGLQNLASGLPFAEQPGDLAGIDLHIDWQNLYRDRLELERRWAEGRFVARRFKGHEVRSLPSGKCGICS